MKPKPVTINYWRVPRGTSNETIQTMCVPGHELMEVNASWFHRHLHLHNGTTRALELSENSVATLVTSYGDQRKVFSYKWDMDQARWVKVG